MNWGGASVALGLVALACTAPPWGMLILVFAGTGVYLWSKR